MGDGGGVECCHETLDEIFRRDRNRFSMTGQVRQEDLDIGSQAENFLFQRVHFHSRVATFRAISKCSAWLAARSVRHSIRRARSGG